MDIKDQTVRGGEHMNQWLDISQRLNENTPYWPGDTQYSYRLNSSMAEGSSVNIGEIRMSTHLGTHIDAPSHFDENGKKSSNSILIYILALLP